MSLPRSQRENLLELTMEMSAEYGLDEISLRDIAARAGASTTAIFQNFKGKAELIAGAVDLAIERDKAFHDELRERVFSLVAGHLACADFIASYVELRALSPHARLLAEVLVKLRDHPDCYDALARWHAGRLVFWEEFLSGRDIVSEFAPVVCEYVVMEELYAHSLSTQAQYRLLLLESCRALCDAVFHHGASANLPGNVSNVLDLAPMSIRGPNQSDTRLAKPEKLLDAAVAIINRQGISGLNQRASAGKVGVSPSMIAYHFKDMRSFTTMAIWRALVQGIPSLFDPQTQTPHFPSSFGLWLEMLDELLMVPGESHDPGFYISFSRLAAEASLLARRTPELLPLISYLRGLEGWGTYRVSQSMEPLATLIGRDHASAFGIWIKSEALLRNAGLVDTEHSLDRLTNAAGIIFPSPDA